MANFGFLEVGEESVVLIYDARTGEIVHRHDVMTAKGGKHPDEKTRERDAHEQFRRLQPGRATHTAVLHVERRAIKSKMLYKVDVQKRVLVEHPSVGRVQPKTKGTTGAGH